MIADSTKTHYIGKVNDKTLTYCCLRCGGIVSAKHPYMFVDHDGKKKTHFFVESYDHATCKEVNKC